MIRITGGKYRSRLLSTPNSKLTKPTMDRVRAGVFSALSYDLENKKILDLFAGSGSYGFESLSRGASEVVFIDNSFEAISSLKENARALKVENEVRILGVDAFSFLESNNEQFDIIFIDPPYKEYDYISLINKIIENNILSESGILVVESENDLEFDESSFKKIKKYKYSLAKIYILRR